MATFDFAAHPHCRIADMMAALGLPNEAFRVVDGVLHIEGVDQSVFDNAIQGLDPLGELRDATSTALEQACARAMAAGIDYKGSRIPTGEKDRITIIGLCVSVVSGQIRGKPLSSKFWVKTQRWIHREFSGDEIIEIWEAALEHVQECQTHYADLLGQVEAATTAAQLLDISW